MIREKHSSWNTMRESELIISAFIIQGDIDNLLKATQDLLTKMNIIEDDKWIMRIEMTKTIVHHRKDERLEVEIRKYDLPRQENRG